jgi:hypothetical protein
LPSAVDCSSRRWWVLAVAVRRVDRTFRESTPCPRGRQHSDCRPPPVGTKAASLSRLGPSSQTGITCPQQPLPNPRPASTPRADPPPVPPRKPPPNAAQRLRTTMAAVKYAFTWLGVRKTLAPEQRTTAARAFHADRELLSAGRRQLDRRRDQVVLQAGESSGRAARSGSAERRPRGGHGGREDRGVTPVGFRKMPVGRSGGRVFPRAGAGWCSSQAGGAGGLSLP